MKQSLEREVKLDVGPSFRLPRLPGRPFSPRVFVSRYHDTPDHRLARAGVTVRCRTEGRRHRWQVKLPRGAAGPQPQPCPAGPVTIEGTWRRRRLMMGVGMIE
jgi:hypothetical protein